MERFQEVINKADKLANEFDTLKAKFDKMLFYLEDDPTTNTKGLISRLSSVEEKLSSMETKAQIDKGKQGVYFVVGGAILWLILNFDKVISFFNSIQIKK